LPQGGQVYLFDKYLQRSVAMEQGAEYRFAITTDSMSQGDKRFELRMGAPETAVAQNAAGMNVKMTPNPATDEVTINYTTQGKEKVILRLLDVSGASVLSQDLGIQQSGSIYLDLENMVAGVYLVEITSGNEHTVQRLVKQ
jgi:hypothetical protein